MYVCKYRKIILKKRFWESASLHGEFSNRQIVHQRSVICLQKYSAMEQCLVDTHAGKQQS
jgi:hypothetical protein